MITRFESTKIWNGIRTSVDSSSLPTNGWTSQGTRDSTYTCMSFLQDAARLTARIGIFHRISMWNSMRYLCSEWILMQWEITSHTNLLHHSGRDVKAFHIPVFSDSDTATAAAVFASLGCQQIETCNSAAARSSHKVILKELPELKQDNPR